MKKSIIIIFAVLTFLLTGCNVAEMAKPVDINDQTEYDFKVPAGAGTKSIANSLEEAGLIQKAYAFTATVKALELDGTLQAGQYKLKKSMSAEEIAQKLSDGDVYIETFKLAIPEGFEFIQIVDRLEGMGVIDRTKFMDIAENHPFKYKFLEGDRQYVHRLEGFMYPATYEFRVGVDELAILTKLLDTFDGKFLPEYYTRSAELGYAVSEIVALASIIERECLVADELKKISSVFHNRLNDSYKLEADSTVQYITKERKEKMYNSDIAVDTPYNTYKYPGLTPSPICNPSIEALEAALYPDTSDLYFFVVTGDNDGRHNFSVTYDEHLKNKREAEAKLNQ